MGAMTTAARLDTTIDEVTAQVYKIPTDAPEADGTLAWSSTTLVLAEVSAGGERGIGYTYGDGACGKLITGPLAGTLTGHNAIDIPARWESMVKAMRNNGRPGLVSCAISAIDTALWDLKGKLLGLPVCRLLGMAHPAVPIYGSGGFTTYDERTTRAQLERWVDEWQIPRVKIKIGESWGSDERRDLDRIALARKVIGPDTELYVDANGAYQRKQAIRVAHAMADHDVTWFEEPVSSDDLAGLREVRDQVTPDVTAGEYGYDLAYFHRMLAAGAVDCLQIDVTRCGASPTGCAPPPWPPPATWTSPGIAPPTCTPTSPPPSRICGTWSTSTITTASSTCSSSARSPPRAAPCGRINTGPGSAWSSSTATPSGTGWPENPAAAGRHGRGQKREPIRQGFHKRKWSKAR
ncbi:mandelate racemase/muconate lactonizing enzyme-like protein [Mycobacterium intracellulare]|nr:mandelate racemase/muconate lactonizing enzyme-like protein [Mycobacterium intracellulare]